MNRTLCNQTSLALLLTLTTAISAQLPQRGAQPGIETLSQSQSIRKIYAPVVAASNKSVVTVMVDGDSRALGTAVAEDLVVTKYSELLRREDGANNPSKLRCQQGKQTWDAIQVSFDRPSDLCLLRLPKAKLQPAAWQTTVPAIGAFLASPDGSDVPAGVGILAALPYQHTQERAFLGIRFANLEGGPAKLAEVVAHGAALAAGLQKDDTVVKFEDQEIRETQELRDRIRRCKPGETVSVTVLRGDQELSFTITLGTNNHAVESGQENVWGELSEVRSGFQTVLQHDTVLLPKQCGGPVVDLNGKVLGVNIARAGRVETLALPAAEVQQLVTRLLQASQSSEPQQRSK